MKQLIINLFIRFIPIIGVVGLREYSQWIEVFGNANGILCPELHTYIPDMHPHQCVSYATICKGVTEAEIKTEVNGTQYVCHPRFQPFEVGTPTKGDYSFHCGLDLGQTLIMERSLEGHYKFYCKENYSAKKCLIADEVRCQYCKFPFFGLECESVPQFYDRTQTNPVRKCDGQCEECDQSKVCSACRFDYDKSDPADNLCSKKCYGLALCAPIKKDSSNTDDMCGTGFGRWLTTVYDNLECVQVLPCKKAQSIVGIIGFQCLSCSQGYFLALKFKKEGLQNCFPYDQNCPITNQASYVSQDNTNEIYYATKCNQCDPGFIFKESPKICQKVKEIQVNCILLDPSGLKCIACIPSYALQPDGTCQQYQCDPKCITCLDTNPEYCTTCDSLKYEIAENGICKCKPEYGLKEGNCVPCTEINCYDCLDDYQFCILCKPGQNRIVKNQQCVCQPGSYDPQNEDQICLACDYSCLNCFGQSNVECTQCLDENISNRILVYNSCQCKIGYADFQLQESKCGKCHPRCDTCSQAADETTNQYCLSCIPGENRVVSDQLKCECQENYGDNFGTKEVCFICDYTCGSCDDAGPTHCVSCLEKSGRYLTASGECLCKTSYFDDQTQNIECSKCHYSCLLCQNSAQSNACLQCPLTREPSDPLATTFECNCASLNTFDDGVSPNCPSCDYTCQTCNGPLSSNCLKCDSTYRQLDLSTCICLIGYYDIGQLECAKCHYSCYQCFDSTIEGCISCSMDLHFRLLKGNICKCIDGYYDELGNAKCKKCSYKCETCETQSEKCLDCPLNSLRTLDPIKGCFCQGEYYEKENEIACQKCHFKCKACDVSLVILLQTENQKLMNVNVNHITLKRKFRNALIVCSSFCYECINNFDNCTSCANDRYLVGSTCRCITKFDGSEISTFDYNGLVKCQKCHHSCGTCLGIEEGDCLNCIESDHRYQVGNTCVCDEGYFDAGLPVCQKCNYKCKGCLKQIESCISCPDNSFRQFVSGFNRCQCIERYYDDGQNEICQKCHYSCLRCNDIETKCELCSIQSDRIYNDQLFSCDCNIGYYDIGIEKCQKCHYSCLSCNSGDANSCDSCLAMNDSNRVLYLNTCKCLFGYFDDGQSPQCQKCDIQCLSCIDHSYQCQSCPQTRKIEANCKCQLGYYDVGLQLCSKCSSRCQTCEISSNNCTSCNSIEFREINLITQTCDCSIGYLEINGICEQCYQSCKTCIQSINKCNSCVQFRILKNNDCICNDGMYESNSDKQCKLCNKTCLTCANFSNYCLTCSTDNFRYFKSGNTCDCMIGYFENSINQNCENVQVHA